MSSSCNEETSVCVWVQPHRRRMTDKVYKFIYIYERAALSKFGRDDDDTGEKILLLWRTWSLIAN